MDSSTKETLIKQWLVEHDIKNCPACGKDRLEAKQPVTVQIPMFKDRLLTQELAASLGLSLPVLPVVTVMCGSCAYVMNFGANAIGVET